MGCPRRPEYMCGVFPGRSQTKTNLRFDENMPPAAIETRYEGRCEERQLVQKLSAMPSFVKKIPDVGRHLKYMNPNVVEITKIGGLPLILGSGCYGTVLLGTHRPTGCPVAIKVLHKNQSVRYDIIREAAFLVEMTLHCKGTAPAFYGLAVLEDHPLYQRTCLVMEFMGDPLTYQTITLDDFVSNDKTKRYFQCPSYTSLSEADILQVLMEIVTKFQQTHSRRIIFHDIKADNILMVYRDGTWHPHLVDFGSAKYNDYSTHYNFTNEQEAYNFFSRYNQLDPALQYSKTVSTSSDVYGLGMMFLGIADSTKLQSVRDIGMACVQSVHRRPDTVQVLNKLMEYRNASLKADIPYCSWMVMLQERARGKIEWPLYLGGLMDSSHDHMWLQSPWHSSGFHSGGQSDWPYYDNTHYHQGTVITSTNTQYNERVR